MNIRYLAIAVLLATASAGAQTGATFTLQQENDSYFSGTDRGYTNGTRLLWTWTPVAGSRAERITALLCRGEPGDRCNRQVSAGLGQTMYTPTNLATRAPIVGDRPYGGWLFGTMMFDATRLKTNDHVELYLGVIGSHAFAEQAQVFIHRHITPQATDPRGWNNQIGEWPAVLATYERSVKIFPRRTSSGVDWFDVTPALGASAGNVFVNGSATATVRLGYDLPQRFVRPIRAVPFSLRAPVSSDARVAAVAPTVRNWDAHVFVVGNVAYVARNIFLDAEDTTYRIEREPNVREYRAGGTVRVGRFRIAYQHTWRSSEFTAQLRRPRSAPGQSWDTIVISVGPNP
jgi:lipid A 3-O-deacylase